MSSIVAVFSGFRNDNLKTDIQTQLNGKVVSALSTQCNLLIYKKTSKGSTKLDEAAAMRIDTITLEDFLAKHKLTLIPDQKEPKKSKKTEGSVVESEPEPAVEPEPEVKPKKVVKKASKKAVVEEVVEPVPEAEAEPEQVVEAEPEPEPEVKKKVVKKSKKPAEPEIQPEPVAEPELEPKAKKVIKKKVVPVPEPEPAVPEIQAEPEAKPEPKAKKIVKPKKTEHLVADPIDTKAEKIEKIKLQIAALQEELSKLEE